MESYVDEKLEEKSGVCRQSGRGGQKEETEGRME